MKLRIPVLVFFGIAIPAVAGALAMGVALTFGLERGFESYLVARDQEQLDAALLDLNVALDEMEIRGDSVAREDLLAAVIPPHFDNVAVYDAAICSGLCAYVPQQVLHEERIHPSRTQAKSHIIRLLVVRLRDSHMIFSYLKS